MFPFFLRTIPSDDYQATAIAHLVRYFQWVYVGVLAIDDAYGKSAVAQFLAEAEQYGLCVAFNEVLDHDHNDENLKNIGEVVSTYQEIDSPPSTTPFFLLFSMVILYPFGWNHI